MDNVQKSHRQEEAASMNSGGRTATASLTTGCCSAILPCAHQRQHPDTICAACSNAALLTALNAACGYLMNAKIDLETGATKQTAVRTIEGGIKVVLAAIAKATGAA